jgi:quercetin dioxygenase-like cupin family protein
MTRQLVALVLCGAIAPAFSSVALGDSPKIGLTLTPEQMNWEPNPRVPELGVARIIGNGKEPGPYVYRIKFPKGRVVQAHSHPDDRLYTVISGTWYIGWGTSYDESKLTALPPGSFYTEPAGAPHFVATPDGEAIVQVTGTGPTTVNYVDSGTAPKQ